MAKKKKLTRRVLGELSRRASSEAAGRRDFLISNLRSRLESLVPAQIRWLFPFVTQFKPTLEEEEEETAVGTAIEGVELRKATPVVEPLYTQYRCRWGDPLTCEHLQKTVQQDPELKYCRECGFPAPLSEKAEIRGSRGRYRVEGLLGRRGMGRLYRGIQLSNNHQVVIREYLLPDRYFNSEDVKTCKNTFQLLAGVSLADGRVQDFRLCQPWEAIADHNEERCYLLTKGNLDLYPTLREYLALNGSMPAIDVRQVLNQVLQTLEFLHTQKFRLPSGQVQQGIAHGNLSLDTLLIARNSRSEQPFARTEISHQNGASRNGFNNSAVALSSELLHTDFFIYVCDLALWESLFDRRKDNSIPHSQFPIPNSQFPISNPSPSQDLVALGYIGFYLLAGTTINPINGQPLDPNDERQWPPVSFALKAFLLRLMGITVPFERAEIARQALLKLPLETPVAIPVVQVTSEEEETVKSPRLLWILLGLLGVGLLGTLIWFLLPKPQVSGSVGDELLLCCINQVSAIPSGKFTYTAEREGTWSYILQQKNLVSDNKTLNEELQERQPKLQLNYRPEPSNQKAIESVRSEKTDFALTSLIAPLPSELESNAVAYDGLVVFVAFSYSKRDKSLPQALNGQITFEQLRQLYTGQITNWRELGGPNLPVRLYIPDETEAVRIFEQRVLSDNQTIRTFRNLQRSSNSPDSFTNSWVPEIYRFPTYKMLRQVIQDFESEPSGVGAIAFDKLSKVFGQCSVYPLALKAGEKDSVQALVQDNKQPINPTTDLCEHKGSYFPNLQVFQDGSYPLGYSLAVVYPRDNSRPPVGAKFAEILRTQEGQQLLGKTGVIPLRPLPNPSLH
ncbi:MAG: serine/threonine protein kinase [Coleofasciculaceae cyanobacterium]